MKDLCLPPSSSAWPLPGACSFLPPTSLSRRTGASRAPSAYRPCPQQTPGQHALLLSLPWLPGRHLGPWHPPPKQCTCSLSGIIKSFFNCLFPGPGSPQAFILSPLQARSKEGEGRKGTGERRATRLQSSPPMGLAASIQSHKEA